MMDVADALLRTLESESVEDANGHSANVVDVLDSVARSLKKLSDAVTPVAVPGHDATGGSVGCLTEAAMGITGALVQIASAIGDLAEAVREHGGAQMEP
jgi:hypothetical protein